MWLCISRFIPGQAGLCIPRCLPGQAGLCILRCIPGQAGLFIPQCIPGQVGLCIPRCIPGQASLCILGVYLARQVYVDPMYTWSGRSMETPVSKMLNFFLASSPGINLVKIYENKNYVVNCHGCIKLYVYI